MQERRDFSSAGHARAHAGDAAGAAMGSIGLLVFALLISQLITDYEPWVVTLGGTVAWMAVSMLLWHIRKHE